LTMTMGGDGDGIEKTLEPTHQRRFPFTHTCFALVYESTPFITHRSALSLSPPAGSLRPVSTPAESWHVSIASMHILRIACCTRLSAVRSRLSGFVVVAPFACLIPRYLLLLPFCFHLLFPTGDGDIEGVVSSDGIKVEADAAVNRVFLPKRWR
jgi:hypothetical protein